MSQDQKQLVKSPMERFKNALSAESVKNQFQNALQDSAPLFIASLIDLYSDTKMQKCEPKDVIMEALKAATLRLPINKSLGFAYLVPYDVKTRGTDGKWSKVTKPQFQIGYKGFVQLALRTGQYRYINADILYEGHVIERDMLSGAVHISGTAKNKKAIGYFAYIEMVNGFQKILCWTRDEVIDHAKRYSKSYEYETSAWKTNFDAMALKTVLRNLLGKYGIMSVEMIGALTSDHDERTEGAQAEDDMKQNANVGPVIDVDSEGQSSDQQGGQQPAQEGPDF